MHGRRCKLVRLRNVPLLSDEVPANIGFYEFGAKKMRLRKQLVRGDVVSFTVFAEVVHE